MWVGCVTCYSSIKNYMPLLCKLDLGEGAVMCHELFLLEQEFRNLLLRKMKRWNLLDSLFSNSVKDLERLLNVFHNGEIERGIL